jgi:hypothetical protein
MEVTLVLFVRDPFFWQDRDALETALARALEDFGEVIEMEHA